MNTQKPISIGAIVAATGLSRATIDRVINKRSGVHPRTQAHVLRVIERLENGPLLDGQEVSPLEPRKIHRLEIVIQGGEAFTGTLLDATERITKSDPRGATLHGVASRSDEETLELIRTLGADSDGLALVGKNIEPVKAALGHLLAIGKPVVALVSDLDTSARSAYVGIDDRAAGQLAGVMLGRCLERVSHAKVAVIVGCASYRCHEDREMGCRTLLRQRFPHIELVEAIKGEESREATYEAAVGLFKKRPDIAGIYNVTGGNQSVAQAIADSKLPRRPLFVTHEVNPITAPLLRGGVIDFLINQDVESLLRKTRQVLIDIGSAKPVRELNHVPFQLVTEFNLDSEAGNLRET